MILQVEVAWQRTYSLGQRVTERIKKRNAQVLQPLLVGLGVVGLAFTLIDRSRVTKLILARRDMSSHQNFATTRYIDVSCFGSSIFIFPPCYDKSPLSRSVVWLKVQEFLCLGSSYCRCAVCVRCRPGVPLYRLAMTVPVAATFLQRSSTSTIAAAHFR